MRNESVIWGIITNGIEFCFYMRDTEDKLNEIEVCQTTYSNLTDVSEILPFYYYPNIVSRKNEEARDEILKRYNQDERVKVKKVKDVLNPETSKQEELITDFINEYKKLIEGNHVKKSEEESKQDRNLSQSELKKKKKLITSKTSVTSERGELIIGEDDKFASHQLTEVVNLFLKENIIQDQDIPLKKGEKQYIVNPEPVNAEGEDMWRPKKVGDGYYIETNHSTQKCKRLIKYLIEKFSKTN